MARGYTRAMNALRDEFFAVGRARSEPADPDIRSLSDCWLCLSPIDYIADPHTTPDSHNFDHYKIVRDFRSCRTIRRTSVTRTWPATSPAARRHPASA